MKCERLTFGIEGGDIRQILALQWQRLATFSTRALCEDSSGWNQEQGEKRIQGGFHTYRVVNGNNTEP